MSLNAVNSHCDLKKVVTNSQYVWPFVKTELLVDKRISPDNNPAKGFIQEPHAKSPAGFTNSGTVHEDYRVIECFGSAEPHSSEVLIHYFEGWDQAGKKTTPILLVHGASCTGYAWLPINLYKMSGIDMVNYYHGEESLAKTLVDKGYRVFALTFSHKQGSNHFQSEQLGNAIDRIFQVLEKENIEHSGKVDLITVGDGCLCCNIHLTDLQIYPWMKGYQNNVRNYVSMGAMLKGIDYLFRSAGRLITYQMLNEFDNQGYAGFPNPFQFSFNPLITLQNIYSGAWSGALEMMYDLRSDLPIKYDFNFLTNYGNVHPDIIMDGGWTQYGYTPGIGYAMEMGNNTIAKVNQKGFVGDFKWHNLVGTKNVFKTMYFENNQQQNYDIKITPDDYPSDGNVYVYSQRYYDEILKNSPGILKEKVFDVSHFYFIYIKEVIDYIENELAQN